MSRRIGIDVGGTKCLGVVVDENAQIIHEIRVPTPSHEALVETLVDVVHDLGDAEWVGVGLPGLITRDGVIRSSPNLPGAHELAVRAPLSAVLAREVRVANDATCAALAEWRSGAATGLDHACMVTLGTGIGGGLVINGQLVLGAQGFAGEVGHMVVSPGGEVCGCGMRGCWERYASGQALARIAGVATGEEVFARLAAGDEAAGAALAQWATWVGRGLANLANVIDPEVFVIGGGVADHASLYIELVEAAMVESLYASRQRRLPSVRVASLGSRAGAIGAALLARD